MVRERIPQELMTPAVAADTDISHARSGKWADRRRRSGELSETAGRTTADSLCEDGRPGQGLVQCQLWSCL